MAVRFQKRVKIAPGLRVNIGKRGASLNAGTRGLSVTKGRDGTHLNTALPGTGLSKRTKVGGAKSAGVTEPMPDLAEEIVNEEIEEAADIAEKRIDGTVFIVTFIVAIAVFAFLF